MCLYLVSGLNTLCLYQWVLQHFCKDPVQQFHWWDPTAKCTCASEELAAHSPPCLKSIIGGELQGFYLHMVTFSWPLFTSPWLLYSIRNMWGLPVVTEILRFLSASVLLFDIICAPWVSCLASFLQACRFSWPQPFFFFFLVVECSWTSWHLDIHSKIIFHG